MYKDKKMHKDFSEAKIRCKVCKKNIKPPASMKLKSGTPHLCDTDEHERFCQTHRSKHQNLFTKERLVFDNPEI